MKTLLKKYTMGFEPWGLALFAAIMLPNLLWLMLPAPNDVLRVESVTPTVDLIGSVCQMAMVFCLCLIRRRDAKPMRLSPLLAGVLICVLVYFVAWAIYYAGTVNPFILLLMTLVPCAAFLLFLLDRGNGIGLIPAVLFTGCHLWFAIANFLILR